MTNEDSINTNPLDIRGFMGSIDGRTELLESCRNYLLMLANKGIRPDLQAKIPPSDMVQLTIVLAHQGFEQFRGTTEQELLGWMTKILEHRIAEATRAFQREKRDVRREVPLDDERRGIEHSLPQAEETPSAHLIAEEEARRLRKAIETLDEEFREVIRLRNWERLTFDEIGQRIGMTEAGVRKRWAKAIGQLQRRLADKC